MLNLKNRSIYQEDAAIPFPNSNVRLGPSGFRDLAEKIPKIAYRTAIYLANQLVSSHLPVYYVLMITASHNPAEYNGVKPSNRFGFSLSDQQSKVIDNFVNDRTQGWASQIDATKKGHPNSRIFIGMDRRQSSPHLYQLVEKALKNFNLQVFSFSHVTTPTLYSYCYCYINETNGIKKEFTNFQIQNSYVNSAISNFKKAASLLTWDIKPNVTLDCANGAVGSEIESYIGLLQQYFDVNIINRDNFSEPNAFCGSDFVATFLKMPRGIVSLTSDKFVSFDGDGDRIIIYFNKSKQDPLVVFDGDRINSVFIKTLKTLLQKVSSSYDLNFKIGCVCTVVSNQGLRKYVESLGVPLSVCPVGIKYLFEEVQNYDAGSLFESSGHGSLFVRNQVYQKLASIQNKNQQLLFLLCLLDLCNNNCRGDGFKDFLVAELCQKYLKLSNQELFMYKQFESVSINLKLKNSDVIKIHPTTGQIQEPLIILDKLSKLSNIYPNLSMILRKSTTERNLVRVRLESDTIEKQEIQKIMQQVKQIFQEEDYLSK